MEKAAEKAYRLFVKKVVTGLPRNASVIADCGRKGRIALVNADTGRVIYDWDCAESFLFGDCGRYSIFDVVCVLPSMFRHGESGTAWEKPCCEILKYADCSSAEELLLKLEIAG